MYLTQPLPFEAKRESSWQKNGGNGDCWRLEPNAPTTLAELEGPGVVSHIWMTSAELRGSTFDPEHLRKMVLRIYWDGETEPSVHCPLGDFFGIGHSRSYNHSSAAFSVTTNTVGLYGGRVSMNCWLPMPFKKSARFEVTYEEGITTMRLYFYIDWRKCDSLPDDTFYFHAKWRRENPTCLPEVTEDSLYDNMVAGFNLTDKYNYEILNVKGHGTFVGVNMYIDNFSNDWWGEGDDMFFIDRDETSDGSGGVWPPDLHGTGSEDYLGHAWYMQQSGGLYNGMSWCEIPEDPTNKGRVSVYRFHLADPIPFKKSLRFSIEHGHANKQSNDYCTVAYWYQSEPHVSFTLAPAKDRLAGE